MRYIFIPLVVCFCAASATAGPKVAVVIGPDAPKLEQYAAAELATQLKQLFAAEVTISDKLPAATDHLILVGSPKTNPAVAKAMGEQWPKLTDQGHLLRSAKLGDRDSLVIGGGSPVATLWAAYELGHHFGIRSLLHGDVLPEKMPELKLSDIDIKLEPVAKLRAWQILNGSPLGFGAWGFDDHKQLFTQLAKLKFNHVAIGINPKNPALPWGGLVVDTGDIPGRKAFKGAKEFVNPALADQKTEEDRIAALMELAKRLIQTAPEYGLTADFGYPAKATQFPIFRRGMLPRVNGKLGKAENFLVVADVPGDLNPSVYFLARRAFDPKLTEQDAYSQFFTPLIGEASTKRVLLGLDLLTKANELIAERDPRSTHVSTHSMPFLIKGGGEAAIPEWWKEAGKLYSGAMNEMYRGIRATFNDPARPMLLYYAKRCEFGVHYFAAMESATMAGMAKGKGDNDAYISHLEKATESVYNGLTSLGDVARDPSDRGVIALCAEGTYRPLTAALKAAEKK